jgi:hypothetical protein
MSSNDAQSNQSQNKPQPGQQKPASGQQSPGQQAPGQQKPSTPNQTSPGNKPNPSAGSGMDNAGKVGQGKDADKSGTDANKSTGADRNRSDKDHAQTR